MWDDKFIVYQRESWLLKEGPAAFGELYWLEERCYCIYFVWKLTIMITQEQTALN
jgi:hypothetical protein